MRDAEGAKSDMARDYEAFRVLVTSLQGRLPRRLLQAAEFALRHPEEMALGTAASIAARAQVQPSTMVRFARRSAIRASPTSQDVFKARIRDRWPEPSERLKRLQSGPEDSPNSDLEGFIAAAQSSLACSKPHPRPPSAQQLGSCPAHAPSTSSAPAAHSPSSTISATPSRPSACAPCPSTA